MITHRGIVLSLAVIQGIGAMVCLLAFLMTGDPTNLFWFFWAGLFGSAAIYKYGKLKEQDDNSNRGANSSS